VVEKSLRDTAVMHALRGTYIMRVDVDRWVTVTGTPVSSGIPAFIAIDSSGKWTQRRMMGAPKTPAELAVAFTAFFHPETRYRSSAVGP
jgi:hypothetical protein